MNYSKYLSNLPRRAKKRILESSQKQPNKEHTYSFSCAMLNLNDYITQLITEWAKENIPEEALYIDLDNGIEGYETTSHVTVKYGLHDPDPNNLTKLVNGYGSINIQCGNIDIFDNNPSFDVLKINIKSDQLMELNKLICDNMEYTDKFDVYIPHATIAYVKKGSCDKFINSPVFNKLVDRIDEIYFTSRSGDEFYIKL